MNANILNSAKKLIKTALEEDIAESGDITTRSISTENNQCYAVILAKQQGIVCGLEVVRCVFDSVDKNLTISWKVKECDYVFDKQVLFYIKGSSTAVLLGERTALNFLGRLSGIATKTDQFVQAVKGTKAKILDTRKTTPGWRVLEKYAVTCGGGFNHRFGLYDMFLIKENHIVEAHGITNAVLRCRSFMKQQNIECKIEVETQNIDQVKEALKLGVDRIMLDNMKINEIINCVNRVNGVIPLEVSGNVTLDNIREIAETGVDYISVGELTHSFKTFDSSLLIRDYS